MTLRSVRLERVSPAVAQCARPADLWRPLDEGPQAPCAMPDVPGTIALCSGAAAETGRTAAALDALEQARSELLQRIESLEAQYRKRCVAMLAQIVSAAAPAICEAAARGAIGRIFDDETGAVPLSEIEMTAAPDIFEALHEACLQRSPPLNLAADERLEPGALRMRWKDGGLDCDVGRSLFAIVDFLNAQSDPADGENRP